MLSKIYANEKLATKFNLEITIKENTKKINNENYSNLKAINSSNEFSNNTNGSLSTSIFNSFINPPSDTIYENIPIMTNSDISAVMDWIKGRVTAVKSPFCWKKTYGRGVGDVLICPPGTIPDETGGPVGLCYPKCKDGYTGVGPVCWQICPSDYTNTGVFCSKGGGSTYAPSRLADCPSGYTNMGLTCFKGASTYGKYCTTIFKKFPCSEGYTDMGCFCAKGAISLGMSSMVCPNGYFRGADARCHKNCPPGETNTGEYCLNPLKTITKATYVRGAGVMRSDCVDGLVKDGALCYPKCSDGMYGVGPVCWQTCPNGMVDCAAGCAISSNECASGVANMVLSPIVLAATIGMTVVGAGKAPSAAQQLFTIGKGSVKVEKTSKIGLAAGKCLEKISEGVSKVKDLTVVKKAIAFNSSDVGKVTKAYGKTAYLEYKMVEQYKKSYSEDFATVTSPDINAQLDQNFHPDVAKYLKEYWAGIQMKEMADQLAFQIANDVMDGLSIISIAEPTGIMGAGIATVQAFTKPICAGNVPFPTAVANKYKNKQ